MVLERFRLTRAEVSGSAIEHNWDNLSKQLCAGKLMPVVKADAYGHNAVFVAKTLEHKAQGFAVALLEEALQLRQQGVTGNIVILEGVYTTDAFEVCHRSSFIPVIHCNEQVTVYINTPKAQRPNCWVKVDIGMHRLGFTHQSIDIVWQNIASHSPSTPTLCGHFSSADNINSKDTQQQLAVFKHIQERLNCEASLANSPAILHWPTSHVQWNRVGISLYGVSASTREFRPDFLKPVMTLIAPVLAIRNVKKGSTVGYGGTWQAQRDSRIATLAIGYADGYPRHASNGAPVWIEGKIVPVVGNVSMDMICIDITDCGPVNVGSEAELWGSNLAVEQVAEFCDTIAYELVTRVSSRVPRVFA